MKRYLLVASLLALGCAGEGPTHLEVQLLSMSGALDNRTLEDVVITEASGQRIEDQGVFDFSGPLASVQLMACPLGEALNTIDPYGSGVGGGPGPRPSFATDAGVSDQQLVSSVDCLGRGLTLCTDGTCTVGEVDLQIIEENGWRRVVVDGDEERGDAHIELRYREVH